MEQLKMSRGNEKCTPIQLPDGYSIRSYKPGDGVGWCKCCIEGGLGIEEISQAVFATKMLEDPTVKPENIYFLISPSGDIAGTVTYQHTSDSNTGCIHMVAIEKSYQGKGLAAPLNMYAVQKMLDDGKKRIILQTDDWRIPAIKTYLRIGFAPEIKDAEMESRWGKILQVT